MNQPDIHDQVQGWDRRRESDAADAAYGHRAGRCACDRCALHGWSEEETGRDQIEKWKECGK